MNLRRVFAVVAIPFVVGAFSFVAPNQANAQSPTNPRVEIPQQRPRPQNQLQKPDQKPQIKHQQRRPQLKKRPPQPQNRIPHNNR